MMLWCSPQTTSSFTLTSPSSSSSSSFLTTSIMNHNQSNQGFALYGRKKGGLTQEDFSSSVTKPSSSSSSSKKKKISGNKKNKKDATVQVSSSLSQWASTLGSTEDSTPPPSTVETISESSSTTTFAPFEEEVPKPNKQSKKNKKQSNTATTRRQRSDQKQKITDLYNQKVQSILSSMEEIITSNNFDIKPLLSYIQELIALQKEQERMLNGDSINFESKNDDGLSSMLSLKQLFSNKQSYDYNLAWVGSDDAICHLGTGLHKVPLARLQDIFLTLSGAGGAGTEVNIPAGLVKGNNKAGKKKKKDQYFITVMEVIRILGPFPNVRNTLQGRVIMNETSNLRKNMSMMTTTSSSSNSSDYGSGRNTVQIVYDSMMDGLGKEIKAGNDDDIRTLNLNVLFANENAIVGVVPSSSSLGGDDDDDDDDDASMMKAFGEKGENVLLFLREDDIDSALDGLRAN